MQLNKSEMKALLLTLCCLFRVTISQSQNRSLFIENSDLPIQNIRINCDTAHHAAQILQKYIYSTCNVSYSIEQQKNKVTSSFEFIHLGSKNKTKFKPTSNDISPEGFEIRTLENCMVFFAHTNAGFNNAVYYFLEHALNCRMFTDEAIVIPKHKSDTIQCINTVQNPAFTFRINHNGAGYRENFAQWHALHNKPHNVTAKQITPSDEWGLWVHTLHNLVPPDIYFETHPEYFAWRNGIRVKDQLCLSNKDVLSIAIHNLDSIIKLNPNAKYWSVSQMDNFNHCQCDKCRAIDEANGSPAGSILSFVNEVAKAFPNKTISTLAYQYSRQAPSNIKPLPNVNIMLCSIECNRNLSISTDPANGSFKNDLEAWSKLTDNILIWDYVINFSNIIGPFPNFQVLKPNIQLFDKNNVSMLFEQGWPHNCGEFTELRCYLLSKLMWNPELDSDSLMQEFCDGYYGKGGKYVYKYIKLAEKELLTSKKALTLYEPMSAHSSGFLSPENIDKYFSIFNNALEEEKDEPYYTRLQLAMQPLRYSWIEVAQSLPFSNNWIFTADSNGNYTVSAKAQKYLSELYCLAKEHGPILFHETSLPPNDYNNKIEEYFKFGYQKHKAVGKTLIFQTPSAEQYNGGSDNSIIDGVRGTDNYFSLWKGWWGENVEFVIDLHTFDTINSVSTNCLYNELSWIFPPEEISVALSSDNVTYTEAASYNNSNARNKQGKHIERYNLQLPKSQVARYVKVTYKTIGDMPEWRGIKNKAWTFIDEIVIY